VLFIFSGGLHYLSTAMGPGVLILGFGLLSLWHSLVSVASACLDLQDIVNACRLVWLISS